MEPHSGVEWNRQLISYVFLLRLWLYSNVIQGSGFDSCAKQWRLFADIMNDIGMCGLGDLVRLLIGLDSKVKGF